MTGKPEWFEEHEADNTRRFLEGENRFKEINERLKKMAIEDEVWRTAMNESMRPLIEVFQTVGRLGRWGKAAFATVAIALTIILTLKNILR